MRAVRRYGLTAVLALLPVALQGAPAPPSGLQSAVAAHYAQIAYASYADATETAAALQAAIERLLDAPTPQTLQAARDAWIAGHLRYGQTEAFRFFQGPIDDARGLEKRINTWPIDASYLDYTQADRDAGWINHPERDPPGVAPLSAAALIQLNQRDSERNVSTGWHAIEFLLWGEDLSATGPGDRPYTDFVAAGANHADRRRAALRALAQLLQADLKSVRDDWAPDAAYRRDFAQNPQALRRALTGFTALAGGELAGERLSTALYTQAQEEEQSCFSDTTDRDMQADLRSLDTVWSGRYLALDARTLDGPGLRAAALNIDAALARRMDVQLAAASAAAQALRAPFDQEIVAANPAGRARIARLIEALQQVADTGKALIRANLRRSKQATR